MAQERQGIVDELVDVDLGELGRRGPGEIKKSSDGLGDPVDILQDDLDLLLLFFFPGFFAEDFEVRGDSQERVINLVGSAKGQLAQGRELLVLGELSVEFLPLGDVLDEDAHTQDLAAAVLDGKE